eukprot:14151034-Ditylum_brightwellii.AAC.1
MPTVNSKALQCNNTYELKCGKDIVNYLHTATFCPCISTWKKGIVTGYFIKWPGLTVEAVNKYLDKSMATLKGHMVQQQQNLCSTKKMTAIPPSDNDKDHNKEESFEQLEEHTQY